MAHEASELYVIVDITDQIYKELVFSNIVEANMTKESIDVEEGQEYFVIKLTQYFNDLKNWYL